MDYIENSRGFRGENNEGLQHHTGQRASGFYFDVCSLQIVKLKDGCDKLAPSQNWSNEKTLGSR